MGTYNARVTRGRPDKNGRREHIYRARAGIDAIDGQPSPVVVETSAASSLTLSPIQLTEGEIELHERRPSTGGTKGRIIYVHANRDPIAFMCLHRPSSGPLMGQEYAYANSLSNDQGRIVVEALLECATELSEADGRALGVLAWSTNIPATRKLIQGFGFTNKSSKPATCKRRFYLRRG